MKGSRSAFLVLILCWCAFAGYLLATAPGLPERVATHFGAEGQPNGWMTRSGMIQFSLITGLLVPGFVVGIFSIIRLAGGKGLNIPRREYWLAPERREETLSFVQRQGFWFGAMFVVFLAGIHYLTMAANLRRPIMLSNSDVAWLSGIFLVATAAWVGRFAIYFYRRPA